MATPLGHAGMAVAAVIVNRIQPGDGDARHGTANGYINHRCRCEPCSKAGTAYVGPRVQAWRRAHGVRPWAEYVASLPRRRHGTNSMYSGGCRCAECRETNRDYMRAWRARRALKTSGSTGHSQGRPQIAEHAESWRAAR
jgi:hypothetical protein